MKKLFLFIFIILAGTAYAQQPTRGALSTLDTTINKPTIKMLAVNVLDNAVVFWNLSYWATIESGSSSGVTSVGLSVPSVGSPFLGVSGSPVTTSGTLALSALGTSSQIVLGDGSLGSALPTSIIPTWQQTLTAGSTLNQDNTVDGGLNDFVWTNNNLVQISSGTTTTGTLYSDDNKASLNYSNNAGQTVEVRVTRDSIYMTPPVGKLVIDSLLNNTSQNTLLGWIQTAGSSRGNVGYLTVASPLNITSGVLGVTAGATSLVVGTTPITSGTTTRILYDNAGVLGEYTITGSGTVVAMQTSPSFVTSVIGGASFDAFNTVSTTLNFGGAATTMTIGGTPTTAITHNYSTNATAAATTKTINFGTGGAASSTTNINIGAANGGTVTINSPNLFFPTTAGIFTVGGGATASKIRFMEASGSGSNYSEFVVQAQSANITYTWPAAAAASNGQALTSTTGGTLSWTTLLSNPMTTTGDMIYSSDNSGTPTRLPIGAANTYLGVQSGFPTWTIGSDVYTASSSNETNCTVTFNSNLRYLRSGNSVTVYGEVNIDPTLTATQTSFEMTLPLVPSSNFDAESYAGGTGWARAIVGSGFAVYSTSGSNTVTVSFKSSDITDQVYNFSFTYFIFE